MPSTHPAVTVEQSCPRLLLHTPVALQVPAQRPVGSSMLTAATQAWAEQTLHAPAQSASLQHPPGAMQVTVVPEVQD